MDVGYTGDVANASESTSVSQITFGLTIDAIFPLRCLMVASTAEYGDDITDVSWGALSLTHLDEHSITGGSEEMMVEWWYLFNPPFDTQDIVINYDSAGYGIASAFVFYGMDITSEANAFGTREKTNGSGSSSGIEDTVPSVEADELALFTGGKDGCGGYGVTVGYGSTQISNVQNTTATLCNRRKSFSAYEAGTGSVQLGFTWTTHSCDRVAMSCRLQGGYLPVSSVIIMGIRRMRKIYQDLMQGLIPGPELPKAWDWLKGSDLVDRSGWKKRELGRVYAK